MTSKTPAELIRYVVQRAAAASENAELAEPGTEGHREPWEPWSADVMLLAGLSHTGVPWLYLACRCGWWLGYAPQHDPADLARIAVVHGENCKLKAAPALAAGEGDPRHVPPPPNTAAGWAGTDEELGQLLTDVFACNRAWSAWQSGTMTEEDFVPAARDPDVVADLAAWRDAAVRSSLLAAQEEGDPR